MMRAQLVDGVAPALAGSAQSPAEGVVVGVGAGQLVLQPTCEVVEGYAENLCGGTLLRHSSWERPDSGRLMMFFEAPIRRDSSCWSAHCAAGRP